MTVADRFVTRDGNVIDRAALRGKYRQERDKRLRPDGNQGPMAYFRYIGEWRKSGAFEGLAFR